MHFVYILINESGKTYIGQTNNLQERLQMHNAGLVRSTSPGRPWQFAAFRQVNDRSEGVKLEMHLKAMKNGKLAISFLNSTG